MRFEKWQALGNDYVIVEERELPFELTAERVRRICDRHTGIGSDGVLLLSKPGERGYVARLRIFNPDGSEAELSGNGAREAVLYLRRSGWTDRDTFSIQTAAGEIRPRITGPTTEPAPWRSQGGSCASSTSPSATLSARSRCNRARSSSVSTWRSSGRRSRRVSCSRTARTCRSGAATAIVR